MKRTKTQTHQRACWQGFIQGVAFMGILSQVSATQVDWSGRDGLQPSEADSGFTQTASSSANVYMSDEALVMETPPDGGASLEYAFSLSEAGAPIVIEVEASSVSERDAAAIKVLSGVNGVSTWLFEASNLRIVMSSAESSVYVPVKTGDRHVYRYEIEGVDVRILIDDRMVFEGVMTAPLKTAKLLIGNVSPGGGSMEIFRISISIPDGQSEMSGENEQNLMDQNPIAWDIPGDQPRAVFKDWPSNADAIIIEASYQASAARQCQWYLLCEGSYGKKIISLANRLVSIAESDFQTERFFIQVPKGTETVRLERVVASSVAPFILRSLKITPVEILAKNEVFERTSPLGNTPIGQSFAMDPKLRILGIAVPIRRSFDSRRIPSRLVCRVSSAGSETAEWQLPAGMISDAYDSIAVFLDGEPKQVGPEMRFDLDSGIAEPRFYGYYQYDLSWNDPYPEGNASQGGRAEASTDITFFILSAIHRS